MRRPTLYKDKKRKRAPWILELYDPWSQVRSRRSFKLKRSGQRELDRALVAFETRDRAYFAPRAETTDREIIETFLATLRGKGGREPSARYRKETRSRLLRSLEAAGALVNLDESNVCDGDLAASTRRDWISTAKRLTAWANRKRLIEFDPLASVDTPANGARTFERIAFTEQQARRIIEAATVRPEQEWRTKRPNASDHALADRRAEGMVRATAYLIGFGAGIRVGELRQLRWEHLDAEAATLFVPDSISKAGRPELIALPPWLVAEMLDHRQRTTAEIGRPVREGEPLFPRRRVNGRLCHPLSKDSIAEHVRRDAAFAGVDLPSNKRQTGFHCLRHSLASWLTERGIPTEIADAVTRHAPTVASTRTRVYVHRELLREPLRRVASLIPDLRPSQGVEQGGATRHNHGLNWTATETTKPAPRMLGGYGNGLRGLPQMPKDNHGQTV